MTTAGITVGVRDKNGSVIEAFFPRGVLATRLNDVMGSLVIMDGDGIAIAGFNEGFWMYWEITGASDDPN